MKNYCSQFLTWAEISAPALKHNLAAFRSLMKATTKLVLVVKANAYGHGLSHLTRLAAAEGVDILGVHQLDEAAEIRESGWTGPILVLGYVPRARLKYGVKLAVEHTVFSKEIIDALDEIGRTQPDSIPCHLKLETGLNRQGITEEELPEFLERFHQTKGLRLAGVSTHFANIEDTTDRSYARYQLERFKRMSEMVRANGFKRIVRHAACTAAILTMPDTELDWARLGIGAYGIWPSHETLVSVRTGKLSRLDLRPVLAWKARIAQIKTASAGDFVGYGCTHRLTRSTRLAVIPLGYSEGYDRRLSGLAHVLIRGNRAPILGRICMNMFMCDVTDIVDAVPEDEVVLIGQQGGDQVTASDLAAIAQTIPYEIVARISPEIPRLLVND
jgi:alanine racemase